MSFQPATDSIREALAAYRAFWDGLGAPDALMELGIRPIEADVERERLRQCRNRERWRAAYAVKAAVKRGTLSRLPSPGIYCTHCRVPGRLAMAYEHRDYRRPMDVRAVCDGCNRRLGSASGHFKHWPLDESESDFTSFTFDRHGLHDPYLYW